MSWRHAGLLQKGLILVAAPLLLELVLLIVLGITLTAEEERAHRIDKYRQVMFSADTLPRRLYTACTALITWSIKRVPGAELAYATEIQRITQELDTIEDIVANNDQQLTAFNQVKTLGLEAIRTLDETKLKAESATHNLIAASELEFPPTMHSLIRELSQAEQNFIKIIRNSEALNPEESQRLQNFIHLCIGSAVLVAGGTLVANVMFYNGMTKRLKTLMSNTSYLSNRKPLPPVLPGTDEIAHLDKVFHEAADALAASDRLKQQFMEMVSHDLRTPINSIMAYLEMLSEGMYGQMDERAVARANQVHETSRRVVQLVSGLLDLEKCEEGMLPLQIEPVEVEELIRNSAETVRDLCDRQKLTLTATACVATVLVDPQRMVQVLVNLLGNAIKFSPPAGTIELSAIERDDWVELNVCDQGRGVPPELQTAIFDRFKQVEIDDDRIKGGSGLGLSLAKSIVTQLGGTIGVESLPGQGSRFWVHLPKIEPHSALESLSR